MKLDAPSRGVSESSWIARAELERVPFGIAGQMAAVAVGHVLEPAEQIVQALQ